MRDFKQTESGDLDLSGGDINMIEPTLQHQRDAILTTPGAIKATPLAGVGAETYFNDENPEDLLRKIRQELIKDGMKVKKISMSDTQQIEIQAYYETDHNG